MKLKNLIFFLAIMFPVRQIHAGLVSESAAHLLAQNFLHQVTGSSPLNLRKVFSLDRTAYVFGHESGFVIVAADDRVTPILGYSNEGRFVISGEKDTITGNNFWSWMKYWQEQIAWLSENDVPASEETSWRWKSLLNGKNPGRTASVVTPLLTTNWGQLWPYNSRCPVDSAGSGGHVAAGCGPLAMAQIMKYHNYPAQGLGSYGYVCGSYPYSGADFGSATYHWDSMPGSIQDVNEHIATLIYHAGVSVKAEWSPGGTTSGASTIMMAFVNYFRMAFSSMKYASRYSYTEAGWHSLLQSELLASRPIYYQGFGTGGHAFVCDGVDAMNLYHFNWGWNGAYNGYYALNDLTPGTYNFNSGQGAIIGIGPNNGSTLLQDTTWSDTVTNNTNIAVPDAITLTLSPGSTIRFAANCALKVWGRLLSVSTPQAYTKLTALNISEGWEGVDWNDEFGRMPDNDSSKLVYTQVEYSKSSALHCIAFGKVLVDHCKINNNFADPGSQCSGIRIQSNPVTVRNSEIYNNGSGGISITSTGNLQAEISGNDIHDNSAATGGGVILNYTDLTISGNFIHHNMATNAGGGIYIKGNLPVIRNNRIVNNYAGSQGGALYLENTNVKILNNLLVNNTAANSTYGAGGGINCFTNSSPVIIGNTIANNYAMYGGGISLGNDCYPLVKNCILYGNQSTTGSQVILGDNTAIPVIDHCDIEGGIGGLAGGGEYDPSNYTNNIDQYPQFVSPSGGAGYTFNAVNADWQLLAGSGCINSGDTSGIANLLSSPDLAGNPRINGIIDIGAYEYFLVPVNFAVSSDTITTGTSVCFNALQTITVGGTWKSFLVQSGGTALFYAGTKISLLPGTASKAGSYLHGQIDPTGTGCPGTAMPSLVVIPSNSGEIVDLAPQEMKGFRVFPNPTSTDLTIEVLSGSGEIPVIVRCYNNQGSCVVEKQFSGGNTYNIILSGQLPGIYLVSVQQGKDLVIKKILKF